MANAAVIGYGFAGRCFHAYLIGLADGLDVYSIATRNPERRAAAAENYPDAVIYQTIDQVIANDLVDLVVLATPHDTHAELAIKAMDNGKHVVTDKIMCMNTAEAEAMIEASNRNNVLLSVFHNRRWDWDYTTVKKKSMMVCLGRHTCFKLLLCVVEPRGDGVALKVKVGVYFSIGRRILLTRRCNLLILPSKQFSVIFITISTGKRILGITLICGLDFKTVSYTKLR